MWVWVGPFSRRSSLLGVVKPPPPSQNALADVRLASAQGYGTFLGSRYKSYNNIVWVLGGDWNPISSTGVIIKPKLEALGAAIAAADRNHLVTIEGCQYCGYPLSTSPYTSARPPSWLSLNWADTTQANAVSTCQAAFGPFLPPLEGEDWYELEHGITGFQARQERYWEVLSGCYVGRIFGNGPIWSTPLVAGI